MHAVLYLASKDWIQNKESITHVKVNDQQPAKADDLYLVQAASKIPLSCESACINEPNEITYRLFGKYVQSNADNIINKKHDLKCSDPLSYVEVLINPFNVYRYNTHTAACVCSV